MHTEADAQKKWCPHMNFSHNSHGRGQCIASECMAWRWGLKPNPEYEPNPMSFYPGGAPASHIEDREHGYCGLAGRP
jgi:hypothetical protein